MRLLRITCYGVFLGIVVLAGVIFLGPQLPYISSLEVKIVKSGSMEPAIKTGGIVFLTKSPTYEIGDIVTFDGATTEVPTTHRIVGTDIAETGETMFVTKGDANEERDSELAAPARIHGKMLLTLPYIGFILDFARKPLGFSLLIVLPALLIILDEAEKIWRELKILRARRREDLSEISIPTDIALAISRVPNIPAVAVPPKVIRRAMDIRKPVKKKITKEEPLTRVKSSRKIGSSSRNAIVTACAVLVLNALFLTTATIGSTFSYLNDTESATGNSFMASALDFLVETDGDDYGFVDGVLNEDDGAVVHIVSPENKSAEARYDLSVEFIGGLESFCNSIKADATTPFIYSGPLPLLTAEDVEFNDPWALKLTTSATSSYPAGTACSINFVYRAYSVDAEGNTGYTDEEKVPLTLTVLATSTPEAFMRTTVVTEPTETGSGVVEIFIPTEATTTQAMTESEEGSSTPEIPAGELENSTEDENESSEGNTGETIPVETPAEEESTRVPVILEKVPTPDTAESPEESQDVEPQIEPAE